MAEPTTRPLAIVTGARRGIGAAIALSLARAGFAVAITDNDDTGSNQILEQMLSIGAQALFVKSDLADLTNHAAAIARITAWGGPVSCLVNNAGVPSPNRGDLLDVPSYAFDRVMGINVRGTFFFTQAVARTMLSHAGPHPRSIITISSVSAELASIDRGEYCLSKSALAMMTKLFALRLAESGVGVFEVRPGIIKTPMTEPVAAKYDERIAAGLVPAKRWGTPEDVARTVVSLAGGQFAFASGSIIHADGGLSIARL